MSEPTNVIASEFCRAFLSLGSRAHATHELASHGKSAVPILKAILSGEVRNEFGVPYRSLGMPVDCALVTIKLLGPIGRPLEDLVRQELTAGHAYAEEALHAIQRA